MRILLVEDEPDFLRAIAQALREEGYAVDAAQDGEEGLYKAEETDYDAIVLDVMLPRLDGFEVLRRLRRAKKTPVLMLTARSRVGDRVQGLDTGADDYLVKPVDLDELAARLRALIRRAHGPAGRRTGDRHRARVRAAGVPGAPPGEDRHAHATLRTPAR